LQKWTEKRARILAVFGKNVEVFFRMAAVAADWARAAVPNQAIVIFQTRGERET
jgi:hypothetical protein